jgi:hypothetical protein
VLPQPPLSRIKRRFWDVLSQTNLADSELTVRQQFAIHSRLINRLESALNRGKIQLDPATMVALFETLFPDCYGVGLKETTPTDTPPQTEDRVQVYARRVRNGEALYDARDACPVRQDRKALKINTRVNSKTSVAGWADDKEEDEEFDD